MAPLRPTPRALLLAPLALLGPVLLSGQEGARPERRTAGVTRVLVEGQLDTGTLALIHRAISIARSRGDRLVVEIDTPGGDIGLMWRIANEILDAQEEGVPTVGWVNDRAWSAGALIALACKDLYMSGHAGMGSAQPVRIGLTGMTSVSPDVKVEEKIDSTMRSAFRGIAETNARPAVLAEAMIDPDLRVVEVRGYERRYVSGKEWNDLRGEGRGVEWVRVVVEEGELLNVTGGEAVRLGLATGIADTFAELTSKIGAPEVDPTVVVRRPSEDLARFLYGYGPLFLLLGVLFGFIEFKVPGFGVFGVLSIVCFGVFLFGRYLVGLADVPHFVLIVIGVVLIAVELFVLPGSLWPGILGALAILAGITWSLVGPGLGLGEELSRRLLLDEATSVALAAFVALLGTWALSRALPRTPLLRHLVLDVDPGGTRFASAKPEGHDEHARVARAGARGRALTALRPVGKVVLDEDPEIEYEARSNGVGIDAERPVRVVEVQPAGRLLVEEDASA